MSLFRPCDVRCCVCAGYMDWHKRYGREACCCSRECYEKFGLRLARSVTGKASDLPRVPPRHAGGGGRRKESGR